MQKTKYSSYRNHDSFSESSPLLESSVSLQNTVEYQSNDDSVNLNIKKAKRKKLGRKAVISSAIVAFSAGTIGSLLLISATAIMETSPNIILKEDLPLGIKLTIQCMILLTTLVTICFTALTNYFCYFVSKDNKLAKEIKEIENRIENNTIQL